MALRILTGFIFVVLAVAYPAAVYYGMQKFSPAFFAVIVFVVGAARFVFVKNRSDSTQLILFLGVIVFCVILLISGSQSFLKFYPVVISTCVGAIFLISLRQQESFIGRLARLSGKKMTARARRYTWTLTLIWAVLLFLNSAVALYLAEFATMEVWALYCGLLSYVIFLAFFALEFLYRQFYMRKHRADVEL